MLPETTGTMPGSAHAGLSVVVCTRNRVRFLPRTLDSLLAQDYPQDRFEVIVVDNDSSDGTRPLVERYVAASSTLVSYQLQRQPGTSLARNLGARCARFEYVAYLDDDTYAPPGWLAAYDDAIRGHGMVAGGGPVRPVLEPGAVPPAWWAEPSIRAIFGLDHHVSPQEDVVLIGWPLWLCGCNCVYPRRLLQEHDGFRPDIGPIGARYRVAEDIEFNARLERAGVPIHYVRKAAIEHTITAARLQRRFIWMRSYAAGITNAAAVAVLGTAPKPVRVTQLARSALRLLHLRHTGRVLAGSRLAYQLGYLRQSAALHRQAATARVASPFPADAE